MVAANMALLNFKELIVWQKSMDLAKAVYSLSKKLPSDERFGLVAQMQRSAISIPSNIAEGNKRGTARGYAHFLNTAGGSAAELETQLLLARNIYDLIVDKELAILIEIQKMLEIMK